MSKKIKNTLAALAINQTAATNAYLELQGFSEPEQSIINDILEAELSESFFNKGHRTQTSHQLKPFTYDFSTRFSKLMGTIFGQYNFEQATEFENIYNNHTFDAVSQLEQQGFYILPEKLSLDKVAAITEHLKQVTFTPKKDHKKFTVSNSNANSLIQGGTAWAFDQQQILTSEDVQALLMDKALLTIIQNYLQAPPIHVQTNAWWSTPDKTDALTLNQNAQLFHQDKEYIKFLKVFIYLTDVTEASGPHQYIQSSHRSIHEKVPEDYNFSDRIPTDQVLSMYSEKQHLKTFTGKAGTIIIEDTSGLHRGLPPTDDNRLMLQFEFCSSLYFYPGQSFAYTGLPDGYKEFLRAHPRFAQNYNDQRYKKSLAARNRKFLKNKSKHFIKRIIKRA